MCRVTHHAGAHNTQLGGPDPNAHHKQTPADANHCEIALDFSHGTAGTHKLPKLKLKLTAHFSYYRLRLLTRRRSRNCSTVDFYTQQKHNSRINIKNEWQGKLRILSLNKHLRLSGAWEASVIKGSHIHDDGSKYSLRNSRYTLITEEDVSVSAFSRCNS